MKKVRAAIVGATGYTGYELIKVLLAHPLAELVKIMASESSQDRPIADIHPQLRGILQDRCEAYSISGLESAGPDLVFTATPNEVSARIVPEILGRGFKVIDLSGAFRLKDSSLYPRWYGFQHPAPSLLGEAIYGLPEINAESIAEARLVANPGCYPTSILLPLAPLLAEGIVDESAPVICDSKSGVTGAGKKLSADLLFTEVSESFKAYNVFCHRHAPEVAQQLGISGDRLVFVPHLLPLNRGILSTIYVCTRLEITHQDIAGLYGLRYGDKPFVRIYGDGKLPELKCVVGSNYCDIGWAVSGDGRKLVIVSAIDNLLKGASGQALQNMNLMFGLPETMGLI